ncbi:heme exporter protein CcmB [Sphingorhabdus soli]|uniref:Heme exporter protein B n=1 Tax=Flavisphingopyxis soli TaxID=2601267 RepID=A0A5C6ULA6_9SPHN|nr:heme exporter protein CcmB [Sphingorhabdus soli]TXC73903.1 heme exporter protein CcmB [Sphingorhabdus soli]
MRLLATLFVRDLARSWRSGALWLPVGFYLLVAMLFPFAVGPDPVLLARTGGGMLWVAALLAALLPVDRLFADDARDGTLDQLALRGIGEESVVVARLAAHWLGFALPLLVATLPAAALLNLDGATLARLAIGLAIGTPALAALGVLVAALTLSLRGAGGIVGLLLLPLAVPVLIFGAGYAADAGGAPLKLLAAASLFLVAITPFAAAAALRAGRS